MTKLFADFVMHDKKELWGKFLKKLEKKKVNYEEITF